MTDDTHDRQNPELADLVTAAEPTSRQKFWNFFGLGYGGNTAVSIAAVKLVYAAAPGLVKKWEKVHEEKYIARKTEEQITPIADKLSPEARAVLEERIAKEGEQFGKDTVKSRILSFGGFAMLPFQSAKQISDYKTNVKKPISDFTDACAQAGMDAQQTESALHAELDRQRAALRPGDKKGQQILDGALEEPKFSPLGPAARDDLPKWITGRVIALGAAFTAQGIVDDRFAKPKAAIDNTLAKIVTRIIHPKGYQPEPVTKGSAFEEQEIKTSTPEGVDPKVLDIVKLITTDAYMTTVAIGAHMISMNFWDKKAPDVAEKINSFRERFSGGNRDTGSPSL